jgi:AcrR family transcriptional regulator
MPPKFKFTREQIIDTAFDIVREKGWDCLTTRLLAEKLGSSARPIYSYFSFMAELEEEIVKKGVDLLYTYMIKKRTDNPWHDHGIGYVLFAMEEKCLFRSINDEKHLFLYKKYGDVIWDTLTATLSDYLPFQGLSEEQVYQIQLHRWLFAHGLAFSVCNLQPGSWTCEKVISTIREGSEAIFTGLLMRFELQNKKGGKKNGKKRPKKNGITNSGLASQ